MMRSLAYATALQLVLLTSLAWGQTPPPGAPPQVLAFVRDISLPNVHGFMDHVGVDVPGHRLFAAAMGNHTVEVIDLKAGKDVKSLPFNEPQNALYVPSVNRLFVSTSGDGKVTTLNGTTFTLEKTVQLSSDADNMRFDARRNHVLVDYGGAKFLFGRTVARAGDQDGAVAVLDTKGDKVGVIPTGGHPESLQLEQKDGSRIFINSPDNHYIVVADLDTNKVLAHWSNPACENYPMALDEAHHRDFVFCRGGSPYIEVVDTQSGRQVTTIQATPLSMSDDMFFDSRNQRLYVVARMQVDPKKHSDAGPGLVEVIQEQDPDHYEKIATVVTGFAGQTGLFVPEWQKLFVSEPAQEESGQSAEILEYDIK